MIKSKLVSTEVSPAHDMLDIKEPTKHLNAIASSRYNSHPTIRLTVHYMIITPNTASGF